MEPLFWFWLILSALCIVVEIATVELVSIWFIPSGIICMVLAQLKMPLGVQIVVFLSVSVVLVLTLRGTALKFLQGKNGNVKTNVDSMVGKECKLLEAISFGTPGRVKVNDVEWSAVTNNEDDELPVGTKVKIVEVKGNKLVVEKVEEPLDDIDDKVEVKNKKSKGKK